MTGEDETREIARSHRRLRPRWSQLGRSRVGLVVLLAIVAVSLGTIAWHQFSSHASSETNRADKATVSAEQLCGQVRALGAACVVDPSTLPKGPQGDTGATGPAGPPPSTGQVQDAVDSYCAIHAECKGAAGKAGATPSADQVAAAVRQFCSANGECVGPTGDAGAAGAAGKDGTNGADGAQGPAGPAPTDDQVDAAVTTFCAANNGCVGPAGPAGKDGKDGADGQPPASFTWTDVLGRTHVCTRDQGSPDNAATYTCT